MENSFSPAHIIRVGTCPSRGWDTHINATCAYTHTRDRIIITVPYKWRARARVRIVSYLCIILITRVRVCVICACARGRVWAARRRDVINVNNPRGGPTCFTARGGKKQLFLLEIHTTYRNPDFYWIGAVLKTPFTVFISRKKQQRMCRKYLSEKGFCVKLFESVQMTFERCRPIKFLYR